MHVLAIPASRSAVKSGENAQRGRARRPTPDWCGVLHGLILGSTNGIEDDEGAIANMEPVPL